ncbi:hypothetical protein [Staphylococcus ureilyticus]|uniref:hypothetical protein n=1 Tax=Staphylococcus ureilyticus TaxID=94138 RepID=UPI003218E8E8
MKNKFLTYLFGNVLFGFMQWFIIILIIKLGTKTDLGIYTYGMAVIAPIILLLSFGFNTLIVTTDAFERSYYVKNRWLMSLVTMIIYMIIIIFVSSISPQNYLLLFLIGLSRIFEYILDVDFGYYIKYEQQHKVGYIKVFLSLIQIIFVTIFYYLFNNLLIPFALYCFVLLLLCLIKNGKYLFNEDKIFNKYFVKKSYELLILGLPLSITLFLSSLNTNIPKYSLEIFSSIVTVGVFSSFLTIYSAGKTFVFSIYNFCLPKVVNNKYNYKFLLKIFLTILAIGFTFLITSLAIYMFIDDFAIKLVFNKTFLRYKLEIMIIIISSTFIYMSIMFDVFINSHNKYRLNTIIQIISVAVVLICSLTLIKYFGIEGATYSFTLFGITVFILKMLLSLKIIKGVRNEK